MLSRWSARSRELIRPESGRITLDRKRQPLALQNNGLPDVALPRARLSHGCSARS